MPNPVRIARFVLRLSAAANLAFRQTRPWPETGDGGITAAGDFGDDWLCG
jgi:hypothetical protein